MKNDGHGIRKHRDWESELMRAEMLADGIVQHLNWKHPDSCVLEMSKELVGSLISARNRLRNQFGRKQWTLTSGSWCNYGKRARPVGWIMRPAKRKWKCQ